MQLDKITALLQLVDKLVTSLLRAQLVDKLCVFTCVVASSFPDVSFLTETDFLFPASPNPHSAASQENGAYDCMQNVASLGKASSPSNAEWRDDSNVSPVSVLTPVCPVPVSLAVGDAPTYRNSFNKTNCRFSVMTSYSPHAYHQGLYHSAASSQDQSAIQHPYPMGHHFAGHAGEHPPSCYRFMTSELCPPGNFLKPQDCVTSNGFVSLPISSQNGSNLDNTGQNFGS